MPPLLLNMIRYSARCFGNTRHDLCVAVGTVFNEVLVWTASGALHDNRVMIAVTLKGHEVHTTKIMWTYVMWSLLGSDILCEIQ